MNPQATALVHIAASTDLQLPASPGQQCIFILQQLLGAIQPCPRKPDVIFKSGLVEN